VRRRRRLRIELRGDDQTGTAAQQTAAGAGRLSGTSSSPRRATAAARRSRASRSTRRRATTSTLQTSCGSFTIRLDQKTSPNAAASFALGSRGGFFDDTIFHRIVRASSSRAATRRHGSGGPGYSTRDSVPANAAYGPGVVAMVKAGNEPAGTAGSQFFVVTGAGSGLTPDYALLGKVTKGMDAVQAIGKLGDPASGGTGTPLQSVVIEKATVSEH
jgi:cyclophilin family peptidyl-prolyl cis-trans isomerase